MKIYLIKIKHGNDSVIFTEMENQAVLKARPEQEVGPWRRDGGASDPRRDPFQDPQQSDTLEGPKVRYSVYFTSKWGLSPKVEKWTNIVFLLKLNFVKT